MTKAVESVVQGTIQLGAGLTLGVYYLWQGEALKAVHLRLAQSSQPPFAGKETEIPLVHHITIASLKGEVLLRANRTFTRLTALDKNGRETPILLAVALTDFQRRLYRRLLAVPAGQTTSYGELAVATRSSPRAVGTALGRNPLPLLIPCHRVLRSDDSLGGFSAPGGALVKEGLLDFELACHGQAASTVSQIKANQLELPCRRWIPGHKRGTMLTDE